jgi:hypothetical protein
MRIPLAGVLTGLIVFAMPLADAGASSKPPHIAGAKYCGEVYKPDDYSLFGYAKGVSCATERSFVTRCEHKRGLQGWSLTPSNQFGFILRKGSGTLDLQIAGGSPLCITDAAT